MVKAIRDEVVAFNEIDCMGGALGRFCGSEVVGIMRRFVNLL